MAEAHLPMPIVRASLQGNPLGFEIAFVTEDVQAAHQHAIQHGATEVTAPESKPWGQTVSYVRTPDGILVELCTAVTK